MFEHLISDEDGLREVIPGPGEKGRLKEIGYLDEHCVAFIARSPIFVLATSGPDGGTDASPRGGPPGFVSVLDEHRIAFADYTGNRRADSHRHILANPRVGLLFMIPGLNETLRINGTAVLTRDPELLESVATGGLKPPKLAYGVTVETAFMHCAKAFLRSELWQPDTWPERDELPSPARMLRDHIADPSVTEADVAERLRKGYAERLW